MTVCHSTLQEFAKGVWEHHWWSNGC